MKLLAEKNVFLVTLQSHAPHSDCNCVLLSSSSTYYQEWRGPGDRSGRGPAVCAGCAREGGVQR